jgi:hypothetical protein
MPTSDKARKPGKSARKSTQQPTQPAGTSPAPALPSIEVFASGRHEDSSVPDMYFSPEFVQGLADEYNAQYPRRRAPATRGHPKPGDPAYGWAARFSAYDDPFQQDEHGRPIRKLVADFVDFQLDFFEAIRTGKFRERSLGLRNGRIHHVAWLGAELPAVKGLAPVEFQEDGPDDELQTINFQAKAGGDEMTAEEIKAAIQEGLKPVVSRIKKLEARVDGQGRKDSDDDKGDAKGKGDKKFSEGDGDGQDQQDQGGQQNYQGGQGSQNGQQKNGGVGTAQFSQLEAQVKAMANHNAVLQGQLLDAQFNSWLDTEHVKSRITPAERPGMLAMMKTLASQQGQIQFSEDGDSLTPLQAFQKTIWDRNPQVHTGEFSQATLVNMYGSGLTSQFAQAGTTEDDFVKLAEQGAAMVNPAQPNYTGPQQGAQQGR